MIITSFYSFLLIDLQSYKLFKFMQIFCRRKKTQKHHQRDGSFDGITTYIINTQIITNTAKPTKLHNHTDSGIFSLNAIAKKKWGFEGDFGGGE